MEKNKVVSLEALKMYNDRIQAQFDILKYNHEQLKQEFEKYKYEKSNNDFITVLGGLDD